MDGATVFEKPYQAQQRRCQLCADAQASFRICLCVMAPGSRHVHPSCTASILGRCQPPVSRYVEPCSDHHPSNWSLNSIWQHLSPSNVHRVSPHLALARLNDVACLGAEALPLPMRFVSFGTD